MKWYQFEGKKSRLHIVLAINGSQPSRFHIYLQPLVVCAYFPYEFAFVRNLFNVIWISQYLRCNHTHTHNAKILTPFLSISTIDCSAGRRILHVLSRRIRTLGERVLLRSRTTTVLLCATWSQILLLGQRKIQISGRFDFWLSFVIFCQVRTVWFILIESDLQN